MESIESGEKEKKEDASDYGVGITPKLQKSSRKSYKSQMTETQELMLKKYFKEKTQYPKHAEKKFLSEKYGVNPFLINKWFQRERNRNKKAVAAEGPKNLIIRKKLLTKDASKLVSASASASG